MKSFAARRPVTALCVIAIGVTVPLQMALLISGLSVFPGKLAELFFLAGTAALITSWIGGRVAVRELFSGLTKWRIGTGRWTLVLLAMPVLTIAVASATSTLHAPRHGWLVEAGIYAVFLLLIALTASVWEETAWSGFVQTRLMERRGLFVGSMITAVLVAMIHLPLAFEVDGWAGTTWSEAFVNWAFLLGSAPFLRYLAGILLIDTRGSVLAVAMLHASFNSAGALSVIPGGWQQAPALVVLTILVAAHRLRRGHSLSAGAVMPVPE